MTKTLLKTLIIALALSPALAFAQTGKTKPTTATYITKEEMDLVSKSQQSKAVSDENTKIIDLGYEISRSALFIGPLRKTRHRHPPAAMPAPHQRQASRAVARWPLFLLAEYRGGIIHDFQTEGYYIVSGGGTMFTDGYVVNGRHSTQNPAAGPNGPTCGGMAYEVKKVVVKPGDVVIVPPGVVHGWLDIPDHVDYLSFRPSQNFLQAGWVNPTIQK